MDRQMIIELLFLAAIHSVSGLTCYKCQNLEVSSSSLLSSSFSGHTDYNCKSLSGSVNSVTCASGYKCGYIGGTVTIDFNYFFGTSSITVNTDIRDCIPASYHSDKCYQNEQLTGFLSSIFSFLSSLSDVSFDGKACYCSTSYCDANAVCSFPGQQLGDECYMWFWPVVGGVSAVASIIAVVACVCCCSSSKRAGVVVAPLVTQVPAVNVIQVPNAGYGRNARGQLVTAGVHQPYSHQPVAYGNPPAYNNPAYNPPNYNNPAYNPSAYGNPAYNPPPYGNPAHNSSAYNQSANNPSTNSPPADNPPGNNPPENNPPANNPPGNSNSASNDEAAPAT